MTEQPSLPGIKPAKPKWSADKQGNARFKSRAWRRAWRAIPGNKEKANKYNREWLEENPEKAAVYAQRRRERLANPDVQAEMSRKRKERWATDHEWREETKRRNRERKRERYETDPEYRAAVNKRNRERKHQMGGEGYQRQWRNLLARDGPCCGICGEYIADIMPSALDPNRRRTFHIDHIVPRIKGGGNELTNLQLAHPSCNISKKDKLAA